MIFARITPALIVGAYPERACFGFALLFSCLWMVLVFAAVAHWIRGDGFLSDGGIFGPTGARDFVGRIVVHETAGLAVLIVALKIGAHRERPGRDGRDRDATLGRGVVADPGHRQHRRPGTGAAREP